MPEAQNHSDNIENWLKLANAEGVGATTFHRLITYFNTVNAVFGASVSQLTKINGIGEKTAEKIARTRDNFNVEKELALADRLGVWIINTEDSRYPPALKKIYDPPPILYIKGSLERQDSLAISIVGSRRCSLYGKEQASRFAHILASAGFTVVSGMARGIDTAAHQGALAGAGRTIAVQGCGLSNIFPAENEKLFANIAQNGACISALPLEYEPLAENFPARNRIIAGLAMAVIVIEASEKSGSLITARLAIESNREVMAVPGKIDSPLSTGSNRLIKQGAKLIDCAEDVMEALGYIGQGLKQHTNQRENQAKEKLERPRIDIKDLNLSDNENKVYKSLDREPCHIEDVIVNSELEVGSINASLISLRLKGLIKQHPGNMFCRV